MRAIINVGLHSTQDAGFDEGMVGYLRRLRKLAAVEWAAATTQDFYVEFRDDGPEPTVVLVLPLLRGYNYQTFNERLLNLCGVTGQGCVAVKLVSSWPGIHETARIVGPKAAEWGRFDEDKFLNPTRKVT